MKYFSWFFKISPGANNPEEFLLDNLHTVQWSKATLLRAIINSFRQWCSCPLQWSSQSECCNWLQTSGLCSSAENLFSHRSHWKWPIFLPQIWISQRCWDLMLRRGSWSEFLASCSSPSPAHLPTICRPKKTFNSQLRSLNYKSASKFVPISDHVAIFPINNRF